MTTRESMEARRLLAVPMLKAGWSLADIGRKLGVSRTTAFRWQKAWEQDEVNGLKRRHPPGRPMRLSQKACDELRLMAQAGAFAGLSCREIGAFIEMRYGVVYHPDHIRRKVISL